MQIFHLRHLVDSPRNYPRTRQTKAVSFASRWAWVSRLAKVQAPPHASFKPVVFGRASKKQPRQQDCRWAKPTSLCGWARTPLSLDQPIGERQDNYLGELLQDHREDDPLQNTNQNLLKSRITEVLRTLDYRERTIIRFRYGLVDGSIHYPAGSRHHVWRYQGTGSPDRACGAGQTKAPESYKKACGFPGHAVADQVWELNEMTNNETTREQLICQLETLRKRIASLEALHKEHTHAQEAWQTSNEC